MQCSHLQRTKMGTPSPAYIVRPVGGSVPGAFTALPVFLSFPSSLPRSSTQHTYNTNVFVETPDHNLIFRINILISYH